MSISRRVFLGALSATGGALLTPIPADAAAPDLTPVMALLEELEAYQGWETAGVACTKAYAAYRLRQALGLTLPDPERARGHLHYQKGAWDFYTRSQCYERDRREGKGYTPPRADL